MYLFDSPSILVGLTELRTGLDKILKLAKKNKVILGKRQTPVAVIVPMDQYQETEALLDRLEDAVLGYIARERESKTSTKDYLTLDQLETRLGLKK